MSESSQGPPRPQPVRPRRARSADISSANAVSALLVALVAGLAVPGSRAGIGLAVAAGAIALVAVSAVHSRDLWCACCLIPAGALTLAPAWRDATWLIVLDLGMALVLTTVALAHGRSWPSLLQGPRTLLRNLPSGTGAVVRGAVLVTPVPTAGSMQGVARGMALGGGLVVVFGALFASADSAFAELVSSVTPGAPALGELPVRAGVGLLAAALAGGLVLTADTVAEPGTTGEPRKRLAPIEWGLALGALAALFAAFVAVQFVVLFGGQTHVLDTAGLTYADYAHKGFGQLLVVAALVLGVVALAKRWARADSMSSRTALRLLLGVLCLLTLVIVASALHRLDIYVDVFGATRLRLWAAGACAAIGVLLVLVAAALAVDRDAWVPRATLLAGGLAAVALTVANPDGLIAQRNVDRYADVARIDESYLASLSADATPALALLPPEIAARVLDPQRHRLSRGDGLFGLNLARARARDELTALPSATGE